MLQRTISSVLGGAALVTAAAAGDALPRVLIIGDSVYRQPAARVAEELRGRAEVVVAKFEPHEVCNTATALRHLDRLLGDGDWDLIHFNFGLGDLVHRAPGMEAFRVLPKHAGGVRTTGLKQYAENLDELVRRLKATGARLVWANTTPIRHSSTGVFEKGTEVGANAAAARVMEEHGVPVNDMYGYVLGRIDMDKPAGHGADPFHFDRQPIYPPVLAAIRRELDL